MQEPKSTPRFHCISCVYSCSKPCLWNRHISTRKHKMKQNETKCNKNETTPTESSSGNFICSTCMKAYNSRVTLWRHRKKCEPTQVEGETKSSITADMFMKILDDNKDLRTILCFQQEKMEKQQEKMERQQDCSNSKQAELITQLKEQQEQIKEQQKQMAELIPKVGNTTNNNNQSFNLQFFLNEQCKDAINWQDFMSTLEVGAPEFAAMTDSTLTEGVAKVICNGIQDLGIYKRPIHCIDAKRKKMCIKDEDTWNHDESEVQGTLHKANLSVKGQYNRVLKAWEMAHPNWSDNEEETEIYMRLVSKVVGALDEKKCTTEIAKNAVIPKEG